jgi:hypothetical protein
MTWTHQAPDLVLFFDLKSTSLSHILVLRSSRRELLSSEELSEGERSPKGLFSGLETAFPPQG